MPRPADCTMHTKIVLSCKRLISIDWHTLGAKLVIVVRHV